MGVKPSKENDIISPEENEETAEGLPWYKLYSAHFNLLLTGEDTLRRIPVEDTTDEEEEKSNRETEIANGSAVAVSVITISFTDHDDSTPSKEDKKEEVTVEPPHVKEEVTVEPPRVKEEVIVEPTHDEPAAAAEDTHGEPIASPSPTDDENHKCRDETVELDEGMDPWIYVANNEASADLAVCEETIEKEDIAEVESAIDESFIGASDSKVVVESECTVLEWEATESSDLAVLDPPEPNMRRKKISSLKIVLNKSPSTGTAPEAKALGSRNVRETLLEAVELLHVEIPASDAGTQSDDGGVSEETPSVTNCISMFESISSEGEVSAQKRPSLRKSPRKSLSSSPEKPSGIVVQDVHFSAPAPTEAAAVATEEAAVAEAGVEAVSETEEGVAASTEPAVVVATETKEEVPAMKDTEIPL